MALSRERAEIIADGDNYIMKSLLLISKYNYSVN
jgi:hypothetical protein